MSKNLALLLTLLAFASALYSPDSKVVKLTANNFASKVLKGDELWFVEFYAPWCGHCQNLVPEWDKAAKSLFGIINVGAVDMTTDAAAGEKYGIRGYPTIKFFGANKDSPVDYNGGRSAQDIINFALDQAKQVALQRLRGGSSGGSRGGSSGSGGQASTDKDVFVLTDSNFDENVMHSDDTWIVEFYAPWCGHCQRLEPEWNDAATRLKGEVKVGKVDATVEQRLGQRFGIKGYPTIKLFPGGKKSDGNVEDYNGHRTAGDITSWALERKAATSPTLKVEQLVAQDVFKTYCQETRGVCLIAFLPHIYDSSATERNRYIDTLQSIADKGGRPVTFLWSQGGDQFELEEALALGSGYPSVVALSITKNKYSVMRAAFSKNSVEDFITGLMTGRETLYDLRQLPKIQKVQNWDGKDKKPETYDDYDLDEETSGGEAGCDESEDGLCTKPHDEF